MKRNSLLSPFLVSILLLSAQAVLAADRGPSTPEERANARKLAANLESNPLGKKADEERKAMLTFLIQIPDVSLNVCNEIVGPLLVSDSKYSSALMAQTMISATAFVFDHPDQANDEPAKQLAGVRGALKAYQAILKTKHKAHLKYLDDLLRKEASGTLEAWVMKQTDLCFKEKR